MRFAKSAVLLLLLAVTPAVAQRVLDCSTVGSNGSPNDVLSRIKECVNLVSSMAASSGMAGIADARNMAAYGSIVSPTANATYTLGANNVTLLLGDYTIVFQGTSYSITPLTIANGTNPVSNFSIIGMGSGGRSENAATSFDFSSIAISGAGNIPLMDVKCTSGCTFKDFQIKGTLTSTTSIVTGVAGYGGIQTDKDVAATDVVLDGMSIVNAAGSGIVLGSGTQPCTDCEVKNSYVHQAWRSGIEAFYGTNFRATNNVILDTAVSVIKLGTGSGGGYGFGIHTLPPTSSTTPSQYVLISDNYVGTSATSIKGTATTGVCAASGSALYGCNQGIQTDGSSHCTIRNNWLVNVEKEAIAVTCTDSLVTGNHVYDQVWANGSGPGCVSIFGSSGGGTAPAFTSQFAVQNNFCYVNTTAGGGNNSGYVVQIHNGNSGNGNGFISMSNGVVAGNIGWGNLTSGLKLTLLDTVGTNGYTDSNIDVHDNQWVSSYGMFAPLQYVTSGAVLTGNFIWSRNLMDASGNMTIPNQSGFNFFQDAISQRESSTNQPAGVIGIDFMFADPTDHWLMTQGGASVFKVQGSAKGTFLTTGNIPSFDSNKLLVDSGVPSANVVQNTSGTSNTLPKFGTPPAVVNSSVTDDGTNVGLTEQVKLKRISVANGTAQTMGNIVLSGSGGGWGTGNSVSGVVGTDQALSFVANSGTSVGSAPYTITVTFKDGAWDNPPICVDKNEAVSAGASLLTVKNTTTATTLTMTVTTALTASANYTFNVLCFGR